LGCLGSSNNTSKSQKGQPEFSFHWYLLISECEFKKGNGW
jgi:hypothetical protein